MVDDAERPSHTGPLAGVRIADVSHWQAGPAAGMLLAFLGAEVIKVESMQHLDYYRRNGEGIDQSFSFHEFNAGKLSVRLNLKHREGANLARRLIVEQCDGMLFNLRTDSLAQAGLGYHDLCRERPDLVVVAISNSGTTGPEAGFLGYATTFVAGGGLAYLSGYADGPPTEHIGWPDTAVGAWGAFTMLAGLMRRQRTGRGGYFDVSGREGIATLVGDAIVDQALHGVSAARMGNRDPEAAPHNNYPCSGDDEWVAIAVTDDSQWDGLCAALGHPAWARDPRFADQRGRWRNQEELDRHLIAWTRVRTKAAVTRALQRFGVPAAPVFNSRDMFADDHLRQRGAFATLHHSIAGDVTTVGPPWRFGRTPVRISRPAPWFGEHDQYVLRDLLGLSEQEIARLTEVEAVY
jgi:crotonobetainyl-CoA:carnitine CoA-transferase CaiB-like acyl-CoA transferase